jgi:putative membrane protein
MGPAGVRSLTRRSATLILAGVRSRASTSPREVGSEPDPRFTLANERTFLAWNRTALALIGAGLAIQQFLDLGASGLQLVIAAPLILLGGLLAATSHLRWRQSERALRLGEPLPYSPLARLLAYGIGAVAVVAAIVTVLGLTLI